MKRFSLWLEVRDEFQKIKGIVFTALFSELDPLEADANLDTEFKSLNPTKIRDMMQNIEIIKLLDGRDPKPIIKTGTVRDFIDFLLSSNEPGSMEQ